MINPDVIGEEEITTWQWIAGLSLLAVLAASALLGANTIQVAQTELPPVVHQTSDL